MGTHENLQNFDTRTFLIESPLLAGFGLSVKDRFIRNPIFMLNGGLAALSLSFPSQARDIFGADRTHVMRNLARCNPRMRHSAFQHYERGGDLTFSFSTLNPEEETLMSLYIDLYLKLQAGLGQGTNIEDLCLRYYRSYKHGLDENLPYGVEAERFIPWDGKRLVLKSQVYTGYEAAQRILGEDQDDYEKNSVSDELLQRLNAQIRDGFWPEMSLHTLLPNEQINWGEDLKTLTPDEITKLADTAEYCSNECQYYHCHVRDLKEFGELIAPVDNLLFGEHLLAQYSNRKESRQPNNKFNVLIPAQADETTIVGILDYLLQGGISNEEIKNNFHFELSDLCVTPLLRVYAELKKRGLLKVARITSSDAFAWQEKDMKFDFICIDHFVDLFPSSGNCSQERLLASLANSLAYQGQLVTTIRCGSAENPLSKESIIGDFYKKVDRNILMLLGMLETNSDQQSSPESSSRAHILTALLLYRKLREVYPFPIQEELDYLIAVVGRNINFNYQIERLKEEKVKLVITKN